ncbi:MAG: hypothetical protein AAGG48_02870 [Planctomycetota bacterium]
MLARIYSPVVLSGTYTTLAATLVLLLGQTALGQGGYYTNDETGIVYQRVTQTIDRPVVETQIEQRQQTVYRPQTVTETTPQTRTIYTPVMEYHWEPRVHGRWNPFQRPTVVYHHVPRTHWEANSEVVQRTSTRTEWVAENRTIDVPRRVMRMEREQKVAYRPVGQVSPTNRALSNQDAIASRLRPLDAGTSFSPLGSTRVAARTVSAPRIASTVGQMQSDPPRRSVSQGGMRATTLNGGSVQGTMPPTLPAPPVFR